MVEEFDLPGQVIENAAAVWGAKVYDEDKMTFLESNQEIADGRTDCHSVEYRAKNRRGEWVWMRCRGHLERDEYGDPTLFAGMITNLGKKNKIDPITGLFNKFEFESQLRHLLEEKAEKLAVMLLGIDDFKRINHLYDRAFGDEVIRIAAQKIQSQLPSTALAYRLDGDEFGVIIRSEGIAAPQDMFATVQKTFSTQQAYDGKKFFCTFSGGCVLAPQDGSDYQELMKYAHYALEYAKHQGKNRLEFFSQKIISHMERSLELTELLRESIENGFQGFAMHVQPVFSLERRLEGAEALTRWQCEKYGSVSPEEFIGLLEESGLILRVGRWIFEESLRICQKFLPLHPDFSIGINISCLQFEDPSFLSFLKESLKRAEMDPSHIIIELTESYLAANLDKLSHLLNEIRGLGIRVAMDDFGTGYSSLGLLKQAPVDIVKIDRTFVRDIQNSAFDHSFIRLVVELCHIVGISVCLEGLETEEEYRITYPMDINYLQGFLLGRPCQPDQFVQLYL